MTRRLPPTILNRTTAFATPWFDVVAKDVRVGSPGQTERYYMIQPLDDYVLTLAITNAGSVPLVRQFRPAVEDYMIELPGGHRDANEEPASTAIRELREETGLCAERVELLGVLSPDCGRITNRLWCFLAEDVPVVPHAGWQQEAGVETLFCPKAELLGWAASGRLQHAHDLAVIALAMSKGRWGWAP